MGLVNAVLRENRNIWHKPNLRNSDNFQINPSKPQSPPNSKNNLKSLLPQPRAAILNETFAEVSTFHSLWVSRRLTGDYPWF